MCSPRCCPLGEDTLAGCPVAGWGSGFRRPKSSAIHQVHRGQQSGILGLPRAVSGACLGTPLLLSPAVSLVWLLVEKFLESPGQCHFVSTLAPLPAHTANPISLCLPITNPVPQPNVGLMRCQVVGVDVTRLTKYPTARLGL